MSGANIEACQLFFIERESLTVQTLLNVISEEKSTTFMDLLVMSIGKYEYHTLLTNFLDAKN